MVLEVDETPHGQLSAWYWVNGGVEGIGYDDDAERVESNAYNKRKENL